VVDGEVAEVFPENAAITVRRDVSAGDTLSFQVRYKSRGEGAWRYAPSTSAGTLRDFHLTMHTNFDEVDFPEGTMSPSTSTTDGNGRALSWHFDRIVTGYGIGMVMPTRIQPGELAASLAFSAPISLFFFFLIVAVLAKLRGLDIHPINYLFLGAAFFSFHLFFAYSVDRISPALAFGIASVISIGMVTAYLRLVVSDRFAFREAALAQLVYLVGFGLAHFLEGFTGLTLTLVSIATLFVVMMLTGRIKWSQTLAPNPHGPFTSAQARQAHEPFRSPVAPSCDG
jgi:inner membrane protein involved in colicin E2 resistance